MKKVIVFALVIACSMVVPAAAAPTIDCMGCHGSTAPKYPILGAKLGYEASVHSIGGNARYSNAGGCQRCHTNEGFIEYVTMGMDPVAYNDYASKTPVPFINYPSQPGCFSCHDPHTTGDMSLRTVKQVTLVDGTIYDGGKGNLCASCHQSRTNIAKAMPTMTAKSLNANWGAHHGPQADVIAGTGGYQFAGKKYTAHTMMVTDSCVTCHMGQPDGRYGFSPKVGGHSFNMAGNVHEAAVINMNACLSCHPDVKQVVGTPLYAIKGKSDYDQNGKIEPIQQEVQGLLNKFVNKAGKGYLQTLKPPMYTSDGKWAGPPADAPYKLAHFAALYNYKLVLEDKSLGVHNAIYEIELLYDSLQALDPKFNVSVRP
ncbi:MAG: hypothetical protein ACOYM2_12965 [Rectinemataceae bacterium]